MTAAGLVMADGYPYFEIPPARPSSAVVGVAIVRSKTLIEDKDAMTLIASRNCDKLASRIRPKYGIEMNGVGGACYDRRTG